MSLRLLVPTLVIVALGLNGCGKTEEPTEQQATPETSSLSKETTSGEMPTETTKQDSAAPSAGQ
jgi:hypothetical protein